MVDLMALTTYSAFAKSDKWIKNQFFGEST